VHDLVLRIAPQVTRFKAASVSGFFLLHNTVEGKPVYPDEMRYIFNLSNSSGGVDRDCIAK
jgi:STAM-binding protein